MLIPAPNLFWNFGAQSSGADELVAGVANFSDVTTPIKELFNAILSGKVTAFDDFADKMILASAATADMDGIDLAMMWIGVPSDIDNTGGRGLIGKRQSNLGYGMDDGAGGTDVWPRWFVSTAASSTFNTVASDIGGLANVILTSHIGDGASGSSNIWTRAGSSTSDAATGSAASVTPIVIGGGTSQSSASHLAKHGVLMFWLGVNAALLGEPERFLLSGPTGLAYES